MKSYLQSQKYLETNLQINKLREMRYVHTTSQFDGFTWIENLTKIVR